MRTAVAMFVAAAVTTLALSGRESPATAQPGKGFAPAPEVGRYQLSAFSYSSPRGQTTGAYIIDTATGDVYRTVDGNKPEPVGPLPKDKK